MGNIEKTCSQEKAIGALSEELGTDTWEGGSVINQKERVQY